MELDIGQIFSIAANIGVISGIVFLAAEVRQNNRLLAAQARYSLRQYRADLADTYMQPHVLEAMHKRARGELLTDEERSTALLVALKVIELWEWQYGEFAAGMLKRSELPVGAWRQWFYGKGPLPLQAPIREVYDQRKDVLNAEFVRFFEENIVSQPIDDS